MFESCRDRQPFKPSNPDSRASPLNRRPRGELDHIRPPARKGVHAMTKKFKVGDHVGWNSEAGRVSGKIIAVHVSDFDYKGHTHRASKDEPQYEIKSDKTD